MSAFQKRVALLEKWVPSLLPQLKDIDDMADIILDVWDEAVSYTEESIIKSLESKRCECLDLTKDEFIVLAKKDGLVKHANCDWVGLDWVITFVKGETE